MQTNTAQRLLQEAMMQNSTGQQSSDLPILRKRSVTLRLDHIKRNPKNREINMDKVKELMESIQLIGLLHDPAVVPLDEAGLYMLVSGEHRYEAHVQLAKQDEKYSTITCKVLDQDDLHSELALLDGNLKSNGLTLYEEVMAIGRREEILTSLDVKGTKRDIIAKALGQKPTQVGKKLRIYKKATPEVLNALKDDLITLEKASDLATHVPEVQIDAIKRLSSGNMKPSTSKKTENEMLIALLRKSFSVLSNLSDFYYDHQLKDKTFQEILHHTEDAKRQIRAYIQELVNQSHVSD